MSSKFVVLEWSLIRDKRTTMLEKLILSEIKQLVQLEKGCVASNQHFADLLGIKRQAASRSIQSLENKGFIVTEIVKGSRNMVRKIRCQQNVATCQQNVSEVSTKCLESKETNNNNKTVVVDFKKNRFQKPTAKQVRDYLKETNNDNKIDADYFVDYYETKDWMVGSSRMKDWKAAVRNWLRRENKPTDNKAAIKAEINIRLSKSPHEKYQWQLPEAEQAYKRIMKSCNLWQANDYQINQALSEVL